MAKFDGTQLYEYGKLHPDWQSCTFNLGRHGVVEFLISSAMYWLEKYHIDGLRVDAVASMLYLDYSRQDGEWEPNIFGGRENLEAVSFVRRLNEAVKEVYPDVQIIAEDSTAWPNVSRPCSVGGLNFDMKWNMGWMHDTLKYFRRDYKVRGKYHNDIVFCLYYAFTENFVLSLSHDEVVYEKGSLIGKMPGNDWEKFANLRALFGYMYSHPGKKLLFMGGEIAQWSEWSHDTQLEWDSLQYEPHKQMQLWVKYLNNRYRDEPALHEQDFSCQGFEWLDMGHNQQAIFSFMRKGLNSKDDILVFYNFKNHIRYDYTVGITSGGVWEEILNSDQKKYGGKGIVNKKGIASVRKPWIVKGSGYANESSHSVKDYSLTLNLPSLSVIFLKRLITNE
jgi:1,4-alpha-glucan branching enzyme